MSAVTRGPWADAAAPITRAASAIAPRELEPLWRGVLWLGKPTLIVGDPGLGKSLVTVDIAARESRGTPWPLDASTRPAGRVLMLSAEDDADDTIVPRLIAAGADLDRITFLDGVRESDEDGSRRHSAVSLDRHMTVLRDALTAATYTLLIVDPIRAFLGRADSHNNAEVRQLLASIGRLAAELRFAVLVVSHLNKVSGANAVYRITGSLAFVAAARAVFAIARDPEDHDRRLMLPVKSNLGPDASGYSYTVSVADNDAPHVRWGDPAIVAPVRDANNEPITLHVTYLTSEGRKLHAPFTARKLLGPVHGRTAPAVHLLRIEGDTLGIGEGLETCLAAALLHHLPVRSALNTALLPRFVPPPRIKRLIIFADNDSAGLDAADRLSAALVATSVAVETRLPPSPHGDWNDVLSSYQETALP